MANTKKKAEMEAQEAHTVNLAEIKEQPKEDVELSGRKQMTKADAQKIVNHYLNISYKGMPADLKEARELLAKK